MNIADLRLRTARPVWALFATFCLAGMWASAAMAAPDADDSAAERYNSRTLKAGSKSPAVLRAQVLLDRARFSPGEIDGVAGSNLRRALSGFQRKNGLPVSGRLDAPTWEALNKDDAPTLLSYELSEDDVRGPFVAVPADLMEKAALPGLGFGSALEALAEKFHASPALIERLNPGQGYSESGAALWVPNVELDAELPAAERILVDGSAATVSVFAAGDVLLAQFPATTGSKHDPLPIGEWTVKGVAKNPEFRYNPDLFWDADPEHSKTRLAPGPNNPVGVVWIDLSKPHYGIHGTPEPAQIGKTQSHGCIRLTNWDAALLATAAKPGLAAILRP